MIEGREKFVVEHYCEHCKTTSNISKEDILPTKINGWDCDEFLGFVGKCPTCGFLSGIDYKIPFEIKEELLDKYANIAGEVYAIWTYQAQINELQQELQKVEKRLEEKKQERIKNPELAKRLYPNWSTNNIVLSYNK